MLRITESGHILTESGDDCDAVIDAIITSNYDKEFCLSKDFSPRFVADLMYAGFLVMSVDASEDDDNFFILLPKHHNVRNILFFNDLHIGKTVKRFLNRYELRAGEDFEKIVGCCVEIHGSAWLTPPLIKSINEIKKDTGLPVRPFSFALFRNGELKAGEFGIIAGRVYTSYSGFSLENSAGRVQMILTANYLRDRGFLFWDLGMPLDYKYTLGAHDVNTEKFIALFREGRQEN
ncbi:hypothetical protein FACS1894190_09930 [Spirochaetia bacterium]|nr:hypothetical protein FACS1894190_09930 [Spirochaetia bacterium]